MKIEHIALWSKDIENLKDFYTNLFDAKCNKKYVNKDKGFESYFLSFDDGARIEIMRLKKLQDKDYTNNSVGLAHFAISVGTKESVDRLTDKIRNKGYTVFSEPRTTGDGYYESIILDPDGNKIEITI